MFFRGSWWVIRDRGLPPAAGSWRGNWGIFFNESARCGQGTWLLIGRILVADELWVGLGAENAAALLL